MAPSMIPQMPFAEFPALPIRSTTSILTCVFVPMVLISLMELAQPVWEILLLMLRPMCVDVQMDIEIKEIIV